MEHRCSPGPIEDRKLNEREPRTPEPQLKRSTRVTKPNLKYTYAVVAEEENIIESKTFEEVAENSYWMNAMEEKIIALKQIWTWDLVLKPESAKQISYK